MNTVTTQERRTLSALDPLRRSGRLARLFKLCLLLAATFSMNGCYQLDGFQSTLSPAGPVAHMQMEVFLVTFWVAVGIFAVVGGLFLYCLIHFRVKGEIPEGTPFPDQGHGNPLLEVGIILVSVLLVGIIAVPTLGGIFYMGTLPQDQAPLVVKVTGLQWWWNFEYPSLGIRTGNELAMPVGKPVKFELHSADVIHSFWVPRLGGKMDVVPGLDNWLWLQGDIPGIFYGQCAEFCGENHAFMRFRVLVLEASQFDAWVLNQKSPAVNTHAPASMAKCFNCHRIRGVVGAVGEVGPDLTHVGSRQSIAAGVLENNPKNLKLWIHNPNAIKPDNVMAVAGYKGYNIKLSEQDENDITAYLSGLK
jgi:cytochrome c oxidase subunit 2